jgi:hypothetical protein
MKNKIQIFKHTTDDWHPNFENNLVSITLIPDDSYGNEFRISIWGEDDCGREKLYKTESSALSEFIDIIRLESISRADLKQRGFNIA